jgi:hypothetical protein
MCICTHVSVPRGGNVMCSLAKLNYISAVTFQEVLTVTTKTLECRLRHNDNRNNNNNNNNNHRALCRVLP